MPRQPVDDVFSSSPAHPSHHNKRNPYAEAQRNFNLKRSAAEAALPSPPTTQVKRKHYVAPVPLDSEDDDGDDTQKTPTKANTSSKRLAGKNPDETTPKGRSTKADNMAPNDASPALSVLAIQESGCRSPSPSPYRQSASPQPRKTRSNNKVSRALMDGLESDSDSGESVVEPATPRRHEPVTPPPTKRTRASTRGPIRDSPNNPFLSDSPRLPKKNTTPLQERATITYVFRGVKVPTLNHLKRNPEEPDPSRLSPSNSDYSPSAAFAPKLLFPSSTASPTPKSKTRIATDQRPESPTRHQRTRTASSSKPNPQPVARKLFTSEIAATAAKTHEGKKPTSWAESSTSSSSTSLSEGHGALNIKAKAMKEGIKKGIMSTSMVIAHAHGPIRSNERPGIQREDTFEFVNKGSKSGTKGSRSIKATQDGDSPGPTPTSSPRRSPRVAHPSKALAAAWQK